VLATAPLPALVIGELENPQLRDRRGL
jgi:hypothetical protein